MNPSAAASVLPSVDAVLRLPAMEVAAAEHGRAVVLSAVREAIAGLRGAMLAGAEPETRVLAAGMVERRVLDALSRRKVLPIRRVFNLTGTVLHTNLGRAPLPPEALAAIADAAEACNLEYDLDGGGRGERDDHAAAALCRLTGAAAALVVNNNAAAVLLALNSLASRREVLVSRGELIEIGGAFRMPDIMARAGCRLREVGTTNRTHLADYAEAIGPRTGAIMKVHPSNYAIEGFTAAVSERDLGALARRHGLPFLVDLGSGSLVDLARFGLPHEPTPGEALAAGADLVTFSGDKLLGGPQAGLVVGRAELVAKLRRNPLKRALRADKLTLAALAAVLRLYDDPDRAAERLPTLRRLARAAADIRAAAERVLPAVQARLAADARVSIEACASQIGSGSLPLDRLASWGIAIRPSAAGRGSNRRLAALAQAFRDLPIPVIGRITEGALVFDLRCLEEEAAFRDQLGQLELPGDEDPLRAG